MESALPLAIPNLIQYSDFIMKKLLGVLLIVYSMFSVSCLFGPSIKKAVSYKQGNVFLSDRQRYQVGELPNPPWKKMRVRAYSIAFHNKEYGSTIATDAFCGPAFEDLPLPMLTSHLLSGVEDYDVDSQNEFVLDDRGALRTVATGTVDGIPFTFDIVVIKKDKCIIDFMCVAPQGNHPMVKVDFETFYQGFRYQSSAYLK